MAVRPPSPPFASGARHRRGRWFVPLVWVRFDAASPSRPHRTDARRFLGAGRFSEAGGFVMPRSSRSKTSASSASVRSGLVSTPIASILPDSDCNGFRSRVASLFPNVHLQLPEDGEKPWEKVVLLNTENFRRRVK